MKRKGEEDTMYWGRNKRRVNIKMAVTGILVCLLISVVVYSFIILQRQREKAISSAKDSMDIEVNAQEDSDNASTAVVISSKEGEGDIYLIKGNDKGSNPYERVDRLAYTDQICYTQEELTCLDAKGLRITRNEIFARHGRLFNDQAIQEYFNDQEWYVPQSSSAVFDENCLNEVEQYNVNLISSYELKQGY